MTEKELLDTIVKRARLRGWRVAHFASVETVLPGGRTRWMTPVRADGKGFPDLLLVRERVLAVEVKGGAHKPTPEQQEWLHAFRLAGCSAHVWTPADLDSGVIDLELTRSVPYVPLGDQELTDAA